MTIAAPHLQSLLEYAFAQGISPRELKNRFLSNPEMDLSLPESQVPFSEHVEIMQEIARVTGDDLLGLHYGCFQNLRALGLIFQISRSASEIGQAIRFLQDFLHSTFPVLKVEMEERETIIVLRLHCAAENEVVQRHLLDSLISVMYRELRQMVGRSVDVQVTVPSEGSSAFTRALGTPVATTSDYSLTFARDQLNAALNRDNLFVLAELLPAFLLSLEKADQAGTFAGRVRHMALRMADPRLPDLDRIAAQFCLTGRTLQRKLKQEKTSFRNIVLQIKKELGQYLSMNRALKTKDIAFILGYSESSAYLHAARKWQD